MKPAWRTVLTVLSLGLFMLAGAWVLRSGADVGEKMFGSLVYGLAMLGGVQGLKSSAEHVADAIKKKALPETKP